MKCKTIFSIIISYSLLLLPGCKQRRDFSHNLTTSPSSLSEEESESLINSAMTDDDRSRLESILPEINASLSNYSLVGVTENKKSILLEPRRFSLKDLTAGMKVGSEKIAYVLLVPHSPLSRSGLKVSFSSNARGSNAPKLRISEIDLAKSGGRDELVSGQNVTVVSTNNRILIPLNYDGKKATPAGMKALIGSELSDVRSFMSKISSNVLGSTTAYGLVKRNAKNNDRLIAVILTSVMMAVVGAFVAEVVSFSTTADPKRLVIGAVGGLAFVALLGALGFFD